MLNVASTGAYQSRAEHGAVRRVEGVRAQLQRGPARRAPRHAVVGDLRQPRRHRHRVPCRLGRRATTPGSPTSRPNQPGVRGAGRHPRNVAGQRTLVPGLFNQVSTFGVRFLVASVRLEGGDPGSRQAATRACRHEARPEIAAPRPNTHQESPQHEPYPPHRTHPPRRSGRRAVRLSPLGQHRDGPAAAVLPAALSWRHGPLGPAHDRRPGSRARGDPVQRSRPCLVHRDAAQPDRGHGRRCGSGDPGLGT